MEKCRIIKNKRIGEININNHGEEIIIIEYNNYNDVAIQFTSTKEIIKTKYDLFKKGIVRSHFSPTVCGVGITGFTSTINEYGKPSDSYKCWDNMLRRCYSDNYQERYPSYIGCSVSEEFKIYVNFKKFYDENHYEIKELGRTELDKDILFKGNKIYSKDNCVFVPHIINGLFAKSYKTRGNLPIGVSYSGNNYMAQCNVGNGKVKRLGTYITTEVAFDAYKEFKEKYIKEIAKTYKSQIPTKLYEAMINYIVEITD